MFQKKSSVGILDQVIEVLNHEETEVTSSEVELEKTTVLPSFPENRELKEYSTLPQILPSLPEQTNQFEILNNESLLKVMTLGRRVGRRVPAVGPLMLLSEEGQLIAKGEGRNISTRGIGAQVLNCRQRVEVGQKVILEVYGNLKLKPFRAEAQILNFSSRRRHLLSRSPRWFIGMRWTAMSHYAAKMIAEYALTEGGTIGGFDYTEKV